MTSPLGIVLAGAGAAVGIVAGLPLVAAAGLGVAAWAARVAVAVPRRARRSSIDPFALPEPWRGFVRAALEAQARFGRAVDGTAAGPLHDRLAEVEARTADGVQECWRVARQAAEIEAAVAQLDVPGARRELDALEAGPTRPGSDEERTAAALRAQLATAERMAGAAAEARSRLRLLDARLDEAVARAVELSVGTMGVGSTADVGGLGDDVDGVVGDLESLRQALEETGRAAPPTPPPPPPPPPGPGPGTR